MLKISWLLKNYIFYLQVKSWVKKFWISWLWWILLWLSNFSSLSQDFFHGREIWISNESSWQCLWVTISGFHAVLIISAQIMPEWSQLLDFPPKPSWIGTSTIDQNEHFTNKKKTWTDQENPLQSKDIVISNKGFVLGIWNYPTNF